MQDRELIGRIERTDEFNRRYLILKERLDFYGHLAREYFHTSMVATKVDGRETSRKTVFSTDYGYIFPKKTENAPILETEKATRRSTQDYDVLEGVRVLIPKPTVKGHLSIRYETVDDSITLRVSDVSGNSELPPEVLEALDKAFSPLEVKG